MADFSHTLTQKVVTSGRTVSSDVAYTGDGQISLSISVPDSTTDQEVVVSIDVSQIKALFMNSTKALTVETNSATVPDDTIVLVANAPLLWHTGSYYTNKLTTNVTTNIFLTNASGSTAQFDLEIVYDSTL